MKTKFGLTIIALGSLTSAHAATLITSTFISVGVTSSQNVDVTGSNVVDWGYYAQSVQLSTDQAFANTKASSGIGAVTVTKGLIGNANEGTTVNSTISFDDGSSPVVGTDVVMGARFGAWAAGEDNAATFNFNDLGVGTHTVRVFVSHSSNSRIFDMDYTVTASDGNLTNNTVSNNVVSNELQSTYEIVFSTTDALADLELVWNSTSGGSGTGYIGGYVVETVAVPEPSNAALLSLGGLALILRRRK
jgi:hypothetical protein